MGCDPMADIINYRVGANLRSKEHGGVLTIVEVHNLLGYTCINRDTKEMRRYKLSELFDRYEFIGYDKTVKLLFGK